MDIDPFISSPCIARLSFNVGNAEWEDTGNTIPYFPPGPPYPTGVTSASRCGLELCEGNKTCELALKTMQKGTNDVDKTMFPMQINAKYVI